MQNSNQSPAIIMRGRQRVTFEDLQKTIKDQGHSLDMASVGPLPILTVSVL